MNFDTNSILLGTYTKLHYVNAIRSSSFWSPSYICVKQKQEKSE